MEIRLIKTPEAEKHCTACGACESSCQQYDEAGLCGTGLNCLGRKVTKEQALIALEDMDDYARMDVGVNPYGPYGVLKRFIEEVK